MTVEERNNVTCVCEGPAAAGLCGVRVPSEREGYECCRNDGGCFDCGSLFVWAGSRPGRRHSTAVVRWWSRSESQPGAGEGHNGLALSHRSPISSNEVGCCRSTDNLRGLHLDGVPEHLQPCGTCHPFRPAMGESKHPFDEIGVQASPIISWFGCARRGMRVAGAVEQSSRSTSGSVRSRRRDDGDPGRPSRSCRYP